jgi:hypothetical protein
MISAEYNSGQFMLNLLPRFFTSTEFLLLLVVGLIVLVARNKHLFPVRDGDTTLPTLGWGAALVAFLGLFWFIFIPDFDLISFFGFPVVFFVFLSGLIFINARLTVFNLRHLIAARGSSTRSFQKSIVPPLLSAAVWIVTFSLPFGFTWEAWHLDRFWSDYQTALDLGEQQLARGQRADLPLPVELVHLSPEGEGVVWRNEFNDDLIFIHGQYHRYGYVPRIWYCSNPANGCRPNDAGYLHPSVCFRIRGHQWYRCGYPLFD